MYSPTKWKNWGLLPLLNYISSNANSTAKLHLLAPYAGGAGWCYDSTVEARLTLHLSHREGKSSSEVKYFCNFFSLSIPTLSRRDNVVEFAVSLLEPPSNKALHCWEPPNNTMPTPMDAHQIKNLEGALRVLGSRLAGSDLLWIVYLCINRQDVSKKGYQTNYMGQDSNLCNSNSCKGT